MKPFRRVHFFDGMILTANDLRAEQEYLSDKQRLHNRLFLGYGIVLGLDVVADENNVTVGAGLAVDRLGREVIVPCPARFALPKSGRLIYLTLSYSAQLTDPVPGSGSELQYRRIEESFHLDWNSRDPGAGEIAGNEENSPLVLARLRFLRKKWKVDPVYRRVLIKKPRPGS